MNKVAVIIVNYNGQNYLPALLTSLFKFWPQTVKQEIIVVDNASGDNSVDWLKANYPQVIILANQENYGFAKGNNLGLKYALSQGDDYAMLLNQDTIVTAGYLDKLAEALAADKAVAAVQPKILLYPQTQLLNSLGNVIHFLGFGYTSGHRQADFFSSEPKEVNYCAGAACLIKLAVLEKVGLFKEELFMYHEDLDLGWRLSLAGYKNVLAPQAIVYHQYEFSRSIKKYYFMERNRLMVMLENYRLATLLLILPAWLVMEAGLLLFAFTSGWLMEKLKVYGYFFSLKVWREILVQRRLTQAQRRLPDRAIVSKFSGLIANQEVKHFLVDKAANPLFNLYWQLIKRLIFW